MQKPVEVASNEVAIIVVIPKNISIVWILCLERRAPVSETLWNIVFVFPGLEYCARYGHVSWRTTCCYVRSEPTRHHVSLVAPCLN